jgi:hypothetical protein
MTNMFTVRKDPKLRLKMHDIESEKETERNSDNIVHNAIKKLT